MQAATRGCALSKADADLQRRVCGIASQVATILVVPGRNARQEQRDVVVEQRASLCHRRGE